MNITLLANSGFLVETEHYFMVFDRYQDDLNCVPQALKTSSKPLIVCVSHWHADHYNPMIWTYMDQTDQPIHYVIDEDTVNKFNLKEHTLPAHVQLHVVHVGQQDLSTKEWGVPGLYSLSVFQSNDEGVAYIWSTEQGLIYHAGDLNAWNWGDGSEKVLLPEYEMELANIQAYLAGRPLDIAFLPVDLRLQSEALLGAKMFLDYCSVRYLCPMHLNGGKSLPAQLAKLVGAKLATIQSAKTDASPSHEELNTSSLNPLSEFNGANENSQLGASHAEMTVVPLIEVGASCFIDLHH